MVKRGINFTGPGVIIGLGGRMRGVHAVSSK